VVRNGRLRKVYAGHQAQGEQTFLKNHVESLPELGRFTMDVQAQKGRQARRAAEFAARGGPILLLPAHVKRGYHGNDSLPVYVVSIREVQPPKGEKRIEWMLLTNEPVRNQHDAWRITSWYERRWSGRQNRQPGWLVLWRGWTKLQTMVHGYLTTHRKRCG
jgi:hypothetical protein